VTTDLHSKSSKPAHPASGRLPVEITPFVGRQAELGEGRDLLNDPAVRLVTILGPGGSGKTRFALKLAETFQTESRYGVVYVPLSHLTTSEELLPALADALGIQLPLGGDLRQAVMDHLDAARTLLLLDNFEHLLESALLVRDILAAGHQVKVLVTSRERLGLTGEVLYRLEGLELPPSGAPLQAERFDAVRLFVQRARQARPGYTLSGEEEAAVARICRLVDGMPLGILLAAARIAHFSPREIADQIGRSLDFLAQELRDLPPRHHSMRAAFDSSFERLDGRQQSAFRKLAVFRGGFTLAAAEAAAGADQQLLLSLAEKSLLGREPATGRYGLHELLLQYAGEKLGSAGEYQEVRTAHCRYYIEFLQQRTARLKSGSQLPSLDEIGADFENIQEAWRWAVGQRDLDAIGRAAQSLYAFCDMRCRFYEGEALFRLAREELSTPSVQPGETASPALALVLLSWYDLHSYIERLTSFEEITSQAQRCLAQAELAGDREGMACSLVLLGAIAGHQADCRTAIRRYEQGMQYQPQLDDFYWVDIRIGLCHQAMGQYEPAIRSFEKSLRRGKALGERVKMGWSKLNIGDTLIMQGERVKAEGHLTDALGLFQETGTTVGVLWADHSLGRIALADGKQGKARRLADDAMQIARQIHSRGWVRKVSGLLQEIEAQSPAPRGISVESTLEPLSKREFEVLKMLKTDLSGPEIAEALRVSLNTVRFHTKNIYLKLNVNNRREAIRRALELGL
jgi:predicted ATPase/DNA-binding CsgD family transcriptional regulator